MTSLLKNLLLTSILLKLSPRMIGAFGELRLELLAPKRRRKIPKSKDSLARGAISSVWWQCILGTPQLFDRTSSLSVFVIRYSCYFNPHFIFWMLSFPFWMFVETEHKLFGNGLTTFGFPKHTCDQKIHTPAQQSVIAQTIQCTRFFFVGRRMPINIGTVIRYYCTCVKAHSCVVVVRAPVPVAKSGHWNIVLFSPCNF